MTTKLFSLAFALLVLASCSSKTQEESTNEEATTKGLIYAANYPLMYFTERIGGESVAVRRVRNSESLPADSVSAMQNADLIVLNGATYEKWTMNVSLDESMLVNTSKSFEDNYLESGETFTHSHGAEGAHSHAGTAFTIWLDLSLAATQAEAIKDAMVKKWPEKATTFNTNFESLKADLTGLHDEFLIVSDKAKTLNFAFSHPVYQYFGAAYGFSGESFHWEPSDEMDADHLHDLEDLNKQKKVDFIIWEGEPLMATLNTLDAKGVKSIVVKPCYGEPDSGDFFTVMKGNLEAVKASLE